ncbi:MAG: TetR/AcrR family transcriptional regulator [Phototrophicaceae bacterium]
MTHSEARERVLVAAEMLFMQKGYEAVTVKDIAKQAGIHHASLYHHVPGGKEDLYVEVMTRNLERHQHALHHAIEQGEGNLHAQLYGVAKWLLSQPPMDMVRLSYSDLPSINRTVASELENRAYAALLIPLETILKQAAARGEVNHPHLGNIAGGMLSAIEGLHAIPTEYLQVSRLDMAKELIDVFIRGIATR